MKCKSRLKERKKAEQSKANKNPARIELSEGGYQFKFLEGMNSR